MIFLHIIQRLNNKELVNRLRIVGVGFSSGAGGVIPLIGRAVDNLLDKPAGPRGPVQYGGFLI